MHFASILADENPWWTDPVARRARRFPVRRDLQVDVLRLVGRLDDRRAAVVVGPRQVGKSVLLMQVADDLLDQGWPPQNLTFFDFEDDRLTEEIGPRQVFETSPPGALAGHPRAVLLDEIGRAPGWDRWLRQAVDEGCHRIVATDSAATLLRRTTRESGPGRWDLRQMETLSFPEYLRIVGEGAPAEEALRRLPNPLERYLAVGGFPEHARSDDAAEVRRRLRSDIADRAVRHDLARLGVDVEQVASFFVYLVQDSGAILDSAARARALGADPRSVREWLRLLEDTLLVRALPRHAGSAAARLRSRPRIYATDHGLVTSYAPMPSPLRDEQVRSRVFEATTFRHLRDLAQATRGELSYFRVSDDLEADFVLQADTGLTVFEVTCNASPPGRKLERLKRAGEILRTRKLVLVHGGHEDGPRGPIRLVPLLGFLLDPASFVQEGGP